MRACIAASGAKEREQASADCQHHGGAEAAAAEGLCTHHTASPQQATHQQRSVSRHVSGSPAEVGRAAVPCTRRDSAWSRSWVSCDVAS